MLCIGATKAGTSWLYRTLSGHPEVHLRGIKELHYFDAIENGRVPERIAEVQVAREALAHRAGDAGLLRRRRYNSRIADHDALVQVLERAEEGPGPYVSYLSGGAKRRHVVGEITPAYGLLPAERLASIARMARDVRFIYILRDPVERLWSHVRMMAVRRSDTRTLTAKGANRILERTFRGEEGQIAIRSDYRAVLEKLSAVVDPGRWLAVYHEEMFEGPALARICAFLGIAPVAPPRTVVHPGQALEMTDDQRADARAWLADQYDYVAKTVGPVPAQWQMELAKV